MYLGTILKSSESEHEQLYIYRTLNEGAHFMPECFPVTFDVLMPKLEQILRRLLLRTRNAFEFHGSHQLSVHTWP